MVRTGLAGAGLSLYSAFRRDFLGGILGILGAAAPAVRAGDAVDVLATLEGEKTFAVAEGATVLAVGADAVTVALSIDETSGVADAIARGAVTLAVRSPVENTSR